MHVHVILPPHNGHTHTHTYCRPLYSRFPMADTVDRNEAEPSDISSALDVEQLDLNLYRSRNLSLNFDARGVFGGQVISQALVAATNCVKPEFTLHVCVPLPFKRMHASSLIIIMHRNRTVSTRTYCTSRNNTPQCCSNDTRIRSAISSLARLLPPHCSTTSTEYVTADHTRRAPSVPSRADVTSSSCSVPSRNRSSGSHRVTGRCHKPLIRMNVIPRSNTSDAWQRIQKLQRRAGRDSSRTQKCVIFITPFFYTIRLWIAED